MHFPRGGIRQLHRRLHRRWSKIWNYGDCDENVCGYLLQGKTKTDCQKTATGGIQVLPRMWLRRVNGGIPWIKQDKDSQITSLWRETDKARVLCRTTRLNVTKRQLRNVVACDMILWRHKESCVIIPPECCDVTSLPNAWREFRLKNIKVKL